MSYKVLSNKVFHIGDRVRAVSVILREIIADDDQEVLEGTVLSVDEDCFIGVAWDKDIKGHNLDGLCEHGHGWWCDFSDIELVSE